MSHAVLCFRCKRPLAEVTDVSGTRGRPAERRYRFLAGGIVLAIAKDSIATIEASCSCGEQLAFVHPPPARVTHGGETRIVDDPTIFARSKP